MRTTQYYHESAGWVSKIRGLVFDSDGFGRFEKIELYRLGDTIFQLVNGTPAGEVSISETEVSIKGWGIAEAALVTTASGSKFIVQKSQIQKI